MSKDGLLDTAPITRDPNTGYHYLESRGFGSETFIEALADGLIDADFTKVDSATRRSIFKKAFEYLCEDKPYEYITHGLAALDSLHEIHRLNAQEEMEIDVLKSLTWLRYFKNELAQSSQTNVAELLKKIEEVEEKVFGISFVNSK